MDGISAAASVLAIGTAGVQISIKLIAFANQVATASERVRTIGVDISLTANVLQQLGELMSKPEQDKAISIFNEEGLATTQASAAACEEVFRDLEVVLKKANSHCKTKASGTVLGEKITLSKIETLKWPFLQPSVDGLRTTLNNARGTLMLILHVTTLAYMKKLAELNYPSAPSLSEQSQQVSAILALRRSQAAPVPSTPMILHRDSPSAPEDNQRAPDSPKSDSSDVRGQDCATEPLPPAPPPAQNLFRSTVEQKTQTTGFRSGPLREANVGVPGPFDKTGFGDEPSRPAQHDQNDRNCLNSSGNALSDDQTSNKHRQNVNTSVELYKGMEVWSIEPTIRRAADHNGYDIEWVMQSLELSLSEFEVETRRFRRLFWQKKQSVSEQLANLSQHERYVLEYFLTEVHSDFPGKCSVKSIKFVKMRPAKEPITRMPWRGIHVLVEVMDAAGKDRRSSYNSKPLFQSRPHGLFGVRQPRSGPFEFGGGQPQSGDLGFRDGQPQSGLFGAHQPQFRIIKPEPRAKMPSLLHVRPRREERDRIRFRPEWEQAQSQHDLSPDSLSSGSDAGDVPGRATSPIHSQLHRRRSHSSAGANARTEIPDAPAPLSEEAESGVLLSSDYGYVTSADPTSEEHAAEPSQRIIDELLAKYTTIYS